MKKHGTIFFKPKEKNLKKALTDNNKKTSVYKIVSVAGAAALTLALFNSHSPENSIKNKIAKSLGEIAKNYQIKVIKPSIIMEYGQNNFLDDVYRIKELMLQQAAKFYMNKNEKWKTFLKMAFILDKIGNPSANVNEIVENMGYYLKHKNEIIGFHSNKEIISSVKNLLNNSQDLATNLKLLGINNQEKNILRVQNALKKILEELNKEQLKEKENIGPDI